MLCREGLAVTHKPGPAVLRRFLIASQAEARSAQPDLTRGVPVTFAGSRGVTAGVDEPLTKAALLELRAAWPRAMPFDRLVEAGQARLGRPASEAEASQLASDLLFASYGALVELRLWQPAWLAGRPVLGSLARQQLANGRAAAASLLHNDVLVEEPILRALFLLLDGSRDLAAVTAELGARVDRGEVALSANVERQELAEAVSSAVRGAAQKGLLLAWD